MFVCVCGSPVLVVASALAAAISIKGKKKEKKSDNTVLKSTPQYITASIVTKISTFYN